MATKKKKKQRARQYARPLFLPHRYTFVAARPFNWKGVHLECGDAVPAWPQHHLRHLHAQSLIGPKDHPWTIGRHASWARRIKLGAERSKARAKHDRRGLEQRAEAADLEAEEVIQTDEQAYSLMYDLFGREGVDGGSASRADTQ